MKANFIVPAINIGGGVREVINLAERMHSMKAHAEVITFWRSIHQMPTGLSVQELTRIPASRLWALATFWYVFVLYAIFLIKSRMSLIEKEFFVFTHYSTIPFSLLVKRKQRVFFVQDLEWRFLGSGVASKFLKRVLIFCFRRGRVMAANSYLKLELQHLDVVVDYNLSIWADPKFKCSNTYEPRDIDFVMVLRRGTAKRLDLYLQFIALCAQNSEIKVAVITPHDELANLVQGSVAQVLLRPSISEMCAIYARSKIFVMLSEHEGFGLPPLEAMGCACVPVCRNSGGIQAYMHGDGLDALVLSLDIPLNAVYEFCMDLIADQARLRSFSTAAVMRFDEGVDRSKIRHTEIEKCLSDMRVVLNIKNSEY